jgi:hypothetical protein
MQHLYGRILKPSRAKSFTEKWTCLLPDTRASHSAPQVDEAEQTIPATSGRISETQLELFSPDTASLKTSMDTYRLDSPQSSQIWKKMVTEQRLEYSARKNAALHTAESGCLSWQTATVSTGAHRQADGTMTDKLDRQVKKWATPNTMDYLDCRTPEGVLRQATGARKGRSRPANLREQVDPVTCEIYKKANWPTTTTRDYKGCGNAVDRKDGKHRLDTLEAVAKFGPQDRENRNMSGSHRELQEEWTTPLADDTGFRQKRYSQGGTALSMQAQGKLNARWVETLMGLPVGWTMPSCAEPVIIAPMNCGCWETVSCLQQQSGHGGCCMGGCDELQAKKMAQ